MSRVTRKKRMIYCMFD